jgi:hypothetical protein
MRFEMNIAERHETNRASCCAANFFQKAKVKLLHVCGRTAFQSSEAASARRHERIQFTRR